MNTPQSIEQLLAKAAPLAGIQIGELADLCHVSCPTQSTHAKGWLGQLLEQYLGANAGNDAMPDFVDLQVELKTLPLDANGRVQESTYVTYAPMPFNEPEWHQSTVYRKLKSVLWVPYCAIGPIHTRTLATPFLWRMSAQWEALLRHDWEELAVMLRMHAGQINGSKGSYLHIRPKAANAKTLIEIEDCEGELLQVVPKGFYLRTSFTAAILQETFSS